MTVTVVIPVYNTAEHIENCVRSVFLQTVLPKEVILVDDGSTDGSGDVCDALARGSEIITVVHQKHQGLSTARNTGVCCATGEYIVFLDSDDVWLLPDGLERMAEYIEKKKPDVLLFKRVDFYGERCVRSADYDTVFFSAHDATEVFRNLVESERFESSACFQLTRLSLLKGHDIHFPEGMRSEDVHWNMQLWKHVKRVGALNIDFYGYQHRKGSVSTTYSVTHIISYDAYFRYWLQGEREKTQRTEVILGYLADMWVSCAYHISLLDADGRREAVKMLAEHSKLLNYRISRKAKRAYVIKKWFGLHYALFALSAYWNIKTRIRRTDVG